MAASTSASILVAALVGAAGGFVAAQLGSPSTPPSQDLGSVQRDAEVDSRLAQMKSQLDDVDQRLRGLALRPIAQPAEPLPLGNNATLDPATLAQVERVAAALDSGMAMNGDAVLIDQVDEAVKRLRDEERDEQRQRRADERVEQIDARLVELQGELGLDSYQVNEMRALFVDAGAKRDEGRDLMRAGEWEAGRELFDELRETTDMRLGEILSPVQLEGYDETGGISPRGFGGPGGGRGGRGGGGGGGGGGR